MSRSRKKNEYQRSRKFDPACRCHGGCGFCLGNRMYQTNRHNETAREQLSEMGFTFKGQNIP